MRCMAALTVLEHFHIFTDRCLGGLVCVILLQKDQGGFSSREEALRHRVVPTMPLAAHPGL